MERLRTSLRCLAVIGLVLTLTGSSIAGDGAFKIIVHPDNPITAIDAEFLRAAFLKKRATWGDGTSIRAIHLGKTVPASERFSRDILKKSLAQLKSYWNQQVFSGKGVPPPEAESVGAMINYVRTHRGAVGYLPADIDPGGAKVVELQ